MKKNRNAILAISLFFIVPFTFQQCRNENTNQEKKMTEKNVNIHSKSKTSKELYGTTENDKEVYKFTLSNKAGIEVDIITYGGRIASLKVPDKNGHLDNIVLGFETLEEYLRDNPFFGALVGRFGNRIAAGKFSLDGQEYSLPQNDGNHHLHGGEKGFDKVIWEATENGQNSIQLKYHSEDMEEGYPGNLEVIVVYTLNDDNELIVDYEAHTDKTTIINLTQHSYFNLSGDFSTAITDHQLEINADDFLPVDKTLIPTGEIRKVEGTPFDFRKSKRISQHIDEIDDQLEYGAGYDHCWVLNKSKNTHLSHAATLYHKKSGRVLKIKTTEPGIQFYAGNLISEGLLIPGTNGSQTYAKRSGLCLETQHFPNSPNQKEFPSVTLRPEEVFSSQTIFNFSIK